jgi:hypothetical protein
VVNKLNLSHLVNRAHLNFRLNIIRNVTIILRNTTYKYGLSIDQKGKFTAENWAFDEIVHFPTFEICDFAYKLHMDNKVYRKAGSSVEHTRWFI